MKKLFLFTAAITLSSSVFVQANSTNVYNSLKNRKCLVSFANQNCSDRLQELFDTMCMDFENGIWNGCPVIIIPGINKPDVDIPEVNEPETNAPEIDNPEIDEIETNQPDTNEPETDIPEESTPEVNVPETSIPETNVPETTKPVVDETVTTEPVTNKPEEDTQELTFAAQVVKLVNEERSKAGLKEVVLDRQIESAALIRSKEIERSFSHTRPNGSNFSTVLKEQGISFRGAGENIAWGQISPEQVMNAWMNSPGHRANILNEKYTKMGVGHYQNSFGRNYWVQLFTY